MTMPVSDEPRARGAAQMAELLARVWSMNVDPDRGPEMPIVGERADGGGNR